MRFFLSILAIILCFLTASMAQAETAPLAYVLRVDGIISPASYDLIHRHLKIAAQKDASVVVLEMHTPGGLYDSMQQIIQDIIESPVPVVTYVSPAGSHAASAGTYILYASHIAAMAPGTNIGAATPVQMGGSDAGKKQEKEKSTLETKMINDAAAYIRTLGELRGRNLEWASKAVRAAESLTTSEALSMKVIDVIATDIPDLMNKIDGRTVKMSHDKKITLKTKGARIENFSADWRTQILEVIANPNTSFLLMSGGVYGLIYEFAHPGLFFPGVVGAICLILALFAMNVLPISYTGLSLIILGIGLMTAEAFVASFGALGIGGAVAFAVGAMMLIDSTTPGFGVDPWLIGAITLTNVAVLSLLLAAAIRTQKKKPVTGVEELLAAEGEIVDWAQGQGHARVTGEIWRAKSDAIYILKAGDKVNILEIDGLTLTVSPRKSPDS